MPDLTPEELDRAVRSAGAWGRAHDGEYAETLTVARKDLLGIARALLRYKAEAERLNAQIMQGWPE